MTLSDDQIRSLVESPSVAAVAYQARSLIKELERINKEEYPLEAVKIRDVLICWPEFVLVQLWKIHGQAPFGATGSDEVRVRELGRLLHQLYSYIRYLTASVPRHAPPAVQAALNQLTRLHFPAPNGQPVCVIRPQWQYNLKFVGLGLQLKNLIAPATLDPGFELPSNPNDDLVQSLWTWRRERLQPPQKETLPTDPPSQIAVLSFAGLDTHDCLLYPILAHELGHFIDVSHDPFLHLTADINTLTHISYNTVLDILQAKAPAHVSRGIEIWKDVVLAVTVCVRELLADQLGLRMMGFSFFAAQSEFLKSVGGWSTDLVTAGGYPGTKFRIWAIGSQLLHDRFPGNIRKLLRSDPDARTALAALSQYLYVWETRLRYGATLDVKPSGGDPMTAPDAATALAILKGNAILKAFDKIIETATQLVPDDKCAGLSPSFMDRVRRLQHDLPPSVESETVSSFAEIMTAGWVYQLCFGEEKESAYTGISEQHGEYQKTCRLIMKAIELMPENAETTSTVPTSDAEENGAVLSRGHIGRRARLPVDSPEHLGIVPLDGKLLEAASLDVRLGNWFVVMRRTRLSQVRLGDKSQEELLKTVGREEIFVQNGSPFLIHPGDLVLGSTLEFVAIPNDLMAFVEGKSRLGRLGLIVATASQVGPGFHGVVVLELANAGTVPLELIPGRAIAQLVFQKMSEALPKKDGYHGDFYCQIKP